MKRRGVCFLGIVAFLVGLFGPLKLYAQTIDVSTGVPAFATLEAYTSISVKVRDRLSHVLKSSVTWGTVSSGVNYALADDYIELNSTSNYSNWTIDIYTENVPDVSTDTANGVYECAGLINTDATAGTTDFVRIPLLWIISHSTLTTVNTGDASVQNTIYGSTTSVSSGWYYIKDKADQDNPGTGSDESWTNAQASGYSCCLYGGVSYRNLNIGINTENPNYIYIEGAFSSGCGGKDYDTVIKFDLSHQ